MDASGNAYLTGFTDSLGFATANPLQADLSGPSHAYITKLNASGNSVIYSTVGIIKSKSVRSVAQKMRQLKRNVRLLFNYLRMTENSCACPGSG